MAIATITGKAYFAKILGRPVPNYNKDGKEWALGVIISEETADRLKQEGFKYKLKETPDGQIVVNFKHPEFQKDGTQNEPLRVLGPDGVTPWPHNSLVGNGSTLNVKFNAVEGKGKAGKPEMKWYVRAVQVFEHVPYIQNDGFEANPNAVKAVKQGEDWGEEDSDD